MANRRHLHDILTVHTKHHLFTLNGIFQYQWVNGENDIYRFNSTLAYAYNF